MDKNMEVWKSGIAGTLSVLKFNRKGDLEHEMVRSGQSITLTRDERELNQEKAATPELDIFTNGMMTPVKLFDDELQAEFASNPNLMSETDMKDLFSAQWRVFDQKVAEIGNTATLGRLLAIAEASDNATVRQVTTINKRIEALKEKTEQARPNERAGNYTAVTAL